MRELRVLELGSGVSAAYAAKLLGDHGADVVKVEEAEGDWTRRRGPYPNSPNNAAEAGDAEQSGTFLALNVNKRGVCIDLDAATGRRRLASFIAWADILVHNYAPKRATELGLDAATLAAQRPDLVVLSITPFGTSGPYCHYKGTELIVANAGGWAGLCPGTHTEAEFPPLKVFGHQCAMMAGTAGAMAALAMAREAARSGVGDFIDLSEQEYTAAVLEAGIPVQTYLGMELKRTHPRGLIPWCTFQAKDAPIFLVCVEQDQWQRLVDFMGQPDWATLEVFATTAGRSENQDLIHGFLQEFIAEWNAFDLYHAAQKHRICCAPIMTYAQLAASEHLRARRFFTTVDYPDIGQVEHLATPVLGNAGRPTIRRRAPRLGEHDNDIRTTPRSATPPGDGYTRLPLAGIRVVDLTWVWAGTFGAMNLAHLGAEVIRFESAERPDLYRRARISAPEAGADLDSSGMFNQWNQGKKSVGVDLTQPRGIELVKRFVAISDVVMQNFATGVMERLGLGYEVLREVNPRIILASISGYGQSGPYRNYMGYGPATSPLTGVSSVTGYVGGGPEEVGVSMPDPNAGITAAYAVVSALAKRDASGVGDHLDVSLVEASAAFGLEAWMQHALNGTQPARAGNRDPAMSPHGCFPCQGEDEWVAIACAADDEWRRLAGLIDVSLLNDARFATCEARKANEDALEIIVSAWTRQRDRWHVTAQLQGVGIAAFPTFTCRDIVEDPHLNARGYIERLAHPKVGARAHTGIPWRLSRRPNGVRSAAPCLGADTHEMLRDLLGFRESEIAELCARGVVSGQALAKLN